MRKIPAITAIFLTSVALFSCSYDSSEIESGIEDLENRIATLEQKADNLESQLGAVSDFVSGGFISRLGTDDKGNYVITYQDKNGERKTVTLAKASDLDKSPMIGTAEFEGVLYWRQTRDNGNSWEWILDKDGRKMPVSGPEPSIGIDNDGYWTVNGESTGVLAKDMTDSIFKDIVADNGSGLVVFSLTDGSGFSVKYNESLGISFTSPSFIGVESYGSPVTVGYKLSGVMAEEAVVDYLTAYNVKVYVNESLKTVSVTLDEGAEEGNVVITACAGDEIVYKPLFFSYGKAVIEFENYIKDNELITPLGEPVINLSGEMTRFTVKVSHSIDVEASVAKENELWLKAVATKALHTSNLDFVADYFESGTNTPREGRIILKNSLYDVSTSILVRQSPVIKGGEGPDNPSDKGIADAGEFMEFVRSVNAGASTTRWENADGEVCLISDIDLTGIEWTPAGNASGEGSGMPAYSFVNAFKGKFNGNGHRIKGINWTCDLGKNNVYGLFGAAEGATIRNLVVGAAGDAITLTGTPDVTPSVAGVVGYAEGVTITNVTNNVSIIFEGECPQAMPASLAGIIGSGSNVTVGGKTKDEAVKNYGDILVKSKVANAQAGGTGLQVAGIMSYVKKGKESSFINCTNYGHLTGPNGRSGGIIATIHGSEKAGNKVTVSKCVNAGLIEDNYLDYDGYGNAKRIGGIIGGSEAAEVTVESCVNRGNIFSHTGCRAGGFVGHFKGGVISGCSNTGIILSHITPQAEDHSGGDGPGWAAGYCNIRITGCTRGGKVGEWADFKSNPESAPDATVHNAYGYQNSKYFNASDNQ